MNAITFDTLSIVNRLKSKGFQAEQAEAIARELQEASQEDHLVTRDYLNQRLETLELRLTMRLGTMIVGLGGVLIAIKYLG